jgi:hypothetical protein
VASEVKDKVSDVASDVKEKFAGKKNDEAKNNNETVYTYTVKFDDNDNNSNV